MKKALPVLAAMVAVAGCGRSSSYYLAKGRELSAKQQYAEAALNFRKAVQKDSRSGEAYYQLGLTEIRLNQRREAFQDLSRALALLPGQDGVKVTLADFSFNAYVADRTRPKMLYDQVTRLSDQLIAANPKSYDGLRLKGYLAASDKKFKDAEEFFHRANSAKPLSPEMMLMWTEVLFQDNQQAEGEKLARQLIDSNKGYGPIYDELFAHYLLVKKSTEAEEILKAKVNNNPSDAGAALQLAAFYLGASRETEMNGVLKGMLNNPAAFPQAQLQVGDFYERMQHWDDALQQYEAGAKANPKEKIIYLKRITNVWLAQGKGEQALQEINEIRKQEPSDEGAQAVQASLLLRSGKPEKIVEAVLLFQGLVKRSPENATWRFNLGRALAAQPDSSGAKREFLEAAKRKPNFLPPRIALAEQSQAEGDYLSALRYANDVLAIDPDRPAVRLIRAVSLINTGNEAKARGELLKLQQIFPKEVELQLAVLDLKQKKFEEAEIGFGKLLQQDPGNTRALSGFVQTEAAQDQLEKALQLLRQELSKSPNSEVVGLLFADAEVSAGKLDPAIEQYQRLVAMNPRSAQYHLSLGRAYQLKGELFKAIPEIREAGRLAPKDPVPPALLAHTMIAAGQTREAMNGLRHALELRPENAALMNDLAYLLVDSGGNLDEALALAQKAVRAAPEEPEMADTLAWIYVKKNLNESALQILRGLVGKYPDRPNFRYHFGMALLAAGNGASAKREFNSALSMNPPADLRQNIKTALAKIG
ncbi:MAG TPA: tetratricopeptide repeat protein [Bryobacteraceae bacterium]|nr:tetratricopeptide repeat protein [Bryobacteraceae bacterium]